VVQVDACINSNGSRCLPYISSFQNLFSVLSCMLRFKFYELKYPTVQ